MTTLSPAETFGRVAVPLFHDRRAARRCDCLCGGELRYDAMRPTATIAGVVLAHNRTPEHAAWWARVRVDWQGEGA